MNSKLLSAIALTSISSIASDLPVLKLEQQFTVSGISSGAYMATQMHLAHAEQITGVGLIAGGPYGCAEGSLLTALDHCVDKNAEKIVLSTLVAKAKAASESGLLAPLSTLQNDRVWAFHGSADVRVAKGVSDAAISFYTTLEPTIKFHYSTDQNTAHVFPTEKFGNACTVSESPFVSACGFNAAAALLEFLLPENRVRDVKSKGQLLTFDQAVFANGSNTLGDSGMVFVPKTCADGASCQLHIAFHGCQQNKDAIGDVFALNAGYNEWADAHNVVILYPQTKSSYMPLNPKACWDWWGYTDEHYATKNGKQIQHVMKMVNALRGEK